MNPEGEHTVGRWLRDRAASDPRRIAIDDRGVLVDYATLYSRAEALADRLAGAGYEAGGRIGTVSGNSVDHVVAFFACAFVGIAFIPLSWRLTPGELGALIARSAPDLVLVDDEHAALAGEALRTLPLPPSSVACVSVGGSPVGVDDARRPAGSNAAPDATPNTRPKPTRPPHAPLGLAGVEQHVPQARVTRPSRPARNDDPLLVIYTSGSEAAPKGVVLTHTSCFWNNLALGRAMPMTSDDVVLAILPQHHVAAWNVQPLLAWWVGATVVLERAFQPDRALQLIQERRVTTMMGVPTQYRMLLDAADAGNYDLSSLQRAVVGGATIPEKLAEDWATRGIALTQGYGLTEAAPNVMFLRPEDLGAFPGAVGRPYPTVDTCIADPETGLPLSGAATGELLVSGPSLFAGYLDDETATANAMRGGWLHTGDLVHRDDAGIHRVVDRLKNIYVSGGENVAPAEVEGVLAEHPLIKEVAVVGVPDDVWGERGFAFVVAEKPLTVDELFAFARTRLASFKLPTNVEFVDELPRSTIEKIARPRLRKLAKELMAARLRESAEPHNERTISASADRLSEQGRTHD